MSVGQGSTLSDKDIRRLDREVECGGAGVGRGEIRIGSRGEGAHGDSDWGEGKRERQGGRGGTRKLGVGVGASCRSIMPAPSLCGHKLVGQRDWVTLAR